MITFEKLTDKINKLASPGIVPGLARMSRMMELLGHPERSFKSIHIAGSNGKGSVASTINAVLSEAGYKTALYTSPHLISFGERLVIGNEPVPAYKWALKFDELSGLIRSDSFFEKNMPTFFEITTAIAFMLIRDEKVDAAVIETGLGGRLDATNVLGDVDLSVITSICMDHMDFLGDTLLKIANEKFAIAHKDKPVVYLSDSEELSAEFLNVMHNIGAEAFLADEYTSSELLEMDFSGTKIIFRYKNESYEFKTSLVGMYQVRNLQLALSALHLLKNRYDRITKEIIDKALAKLKWPCRFELVLESPLLIFDGAHNPQAMKMLYETLKELGLDKKVRIVIAMMHDKDMKNSLRYLTELSPEIYCTKVPELPRSASAEELKNVIEELGMNVIGAFNEPSAAIKNAVSKDYVTVVCGSLYLLGYIKTNIKINNILNGVEKIG